MGCGSSVAASGAVGDAPIKPTPLDTSGKGKYDMKAVFAQFDADGDGKLDIYEIARAFRAIGLTKRAGEKADMDKAMLCVSPRGEHNTEKPTPSRICLQLTPAHSSIWVPPPPASAASPSTRTATAS